MKNKNAWQIKGALIVNDKKERFNDFVMLENYNYLDEENKDKLGILGQELW